MKQKMKKLTYSLLAINTLVILIIVSFINANRPEIIHEQTSERIASNQPVDSTGKASDRQDGFEQAKKSETNASDNSISKSSPPQSVIIRNSSDEPTFQTLSGDTYPIRTYKPLALDDPYANQWWTTDTNLDIAWNIGPGEYQTTIAVIDSGFGLTHEEFSGRWANNTGETGETVTQNPSRLNCSDQGKALDKSCNLIDDDYDGVVDNETGSTTRQNPSRLNCSDQGKALDKSCNLIDDDGNNYVDDVTGWDFANNDPSVQAGETNPDGEDTWHGTAVAGVMAATGNNSVGIAGVNWSTKILPIQAIDDDSYGNTLTAARAIYYAVSRNVDIINFSLGSDEEDNYLRQAIQYAIDNGIIVVAAGGNDSCNCILYPARYPEVLAVGAEDTDGTAASFSSYGSSLDIMAPGVGIRTSSWDKNNPTSAYVNNAAGTSFSTPYVSGLLGLARSHQPDASWTELIGSLLATATHTGLSVTNPTSIYIGSGFSDAGALITRVSVPDESPSRYYLRPMPIEGTLSSDQVYQCILPADFPTTLLYRISNTTRTFFTVDKLEVVRAQARGDSIRSLGHACIGLPDDSVTTIREINLFSELENNPRYKLR